MFRKFSIIAKTAWQKNLSYRFTTLAYRVGEVAEILVLVFMWIAIYGGGQGIVKGFTLDEMITYILIGNVFAVCTRNFISEYVARDIFDGTLSMFLVRPIPYFKYVVFNESGRLLLALIFSIVSQILMIFFFFKNIVWNTDPLYLLVIILMIILAFVTEFLISFAIGLIAFWTDEVEGIYTTATRVKKFFSGGYFPLSLLPVTAATIGSFLPFAYTFYVPAQLYLKKISITEGLVGLGVQVVWIMLLSILLRFIWTRGLKRFEGVGL
jgi:ABC-2 type transport system permease protein